MTPIVLGSQSPRRREILEYFSVPFIQAHSNFEETTVSYRGDPVQYAIDISEGKANALHEQYPNQCILTADTVVFLEGQIFEKPHNENEAYSFLTQFSGKTQQVYTAVSVLFDNQVYSEVECTDVHFNELAEDQILSYLRRMNWKDKAGGYTIQKSGALLVKEIRGCYYNVMGFPVNTVNKLLKLTGINLWQHLKER